MIKDAVLNNLDDIIALNAQVQKLHTQIEPSYFRAASDNEELKTFFSDVLARNNNHILLAFDGQKPAGYLWYELQEHPQTPLTYARRRVYVHHIAVDISARRQGVASALLLQMEEKARAQGVDKIVLDTWASNYEAQVFFTAAGFSSLKFVLGKSLAP